MFMRSIMPTRTPLKTETLLGDESASLFICGSVLVFIPADSAGLSSQDPNDVLPSPGISHQSVYEPPFPVIIPPRQR